MHIMKKATLGTWLGFNSLDVVIGLGDAREITLLRLAWPSGVIQEISNVPTNQTLEVVEPIQLAAVQKPRTEAGTVEVRLTGAAARPLGVVASSDLVHWLALELDAQQGNDLSFRDPESPTGPHRFYRVRVP